MFVKKNKLYKYSKNKKIGPLSFSIENGKLSLTPFAVSRDGKCLFIEIRFLLNIELLLIFFLKFFFSIQLKIYMFILGTKYFCCDNYIGDVIDTGTDIICIKENIFYIYDVLTVSGKYVELRPNNKAKIDDKMFSSMKESDLKNVCFYFVDKEGRLCLMITKTCITK